MSIHNAVSLSGGTPTQRQILEFTELILSSAKTGGQIIGLSRRQRDFARQRGLLFEMLADQFGHLKHGDLFLAAEDGL